MFLLLLMRAHVLPPPGKEEALPVERVHGSTGSAVVRAR
jgi:hypothetical protein